jgi:hypothetical protein
VEQRKDASSASARSAIAPSATDILTGAASGERSQQAEVAIAPFPRSSESPARIVGRMGVVVLAVGCKI